MRILEFEKKFQEESTLNETLEELKDDFETVDRCAGYMKDKITDNPEEVKNTLNELSGAFSNLRTALSVAESEKKNREVVKYNQLRIEIENSGKKFVSASADKEASQSVAQYRRVRNIILGYKEACQTAISSLQSLLKYMITEKTTEQGG